MKADLNNYADELLVQHYLYTRNDKAFEIIFDRYAHLIYLVCLKYVKDEMLAEDIALEVFETLVKQKDDKVIANLKSWLYTVAKNRSLDILAGKRTVTIEGRQIEAEPIPGKEGNELVLLLLYRFVQLLKYEQKCCVELFYFEGLHYDKIAELTGFSTKKVKSALQNGKRNLRLLFEKTPGFRYETVQTFFR